MGYIAREEASGTVIFLANPPIGVGAVCHGDGLALAKLELVFALRLVRVMGNN